MRKEGSAPEHPSRCICWGARPFEVGGTFFFPCILPLEKNTFPSIEKNPEKKSFSRMQNALPPSRYIDWGAQEHFLSSPKLKTGSVTSCFVLKSCFWRLRHLCTGRVSHRLFFHPNGKSEAAAPLETYGGRPIHASRHVGTPGTRWSK